MVDSKEVKIEKKIANSKKDKNVEAFPSGHALAKAFHFKSKQMLQGNGAGISPKMHKTDAHQAKLMYNNNRQKKQK